MGRNIEKSFVPRIAKECLKKKRLEKEKSERATELNCLKRTGRVLKEKTAQVPKW